VRKISELIRNAHCNNRLVGKQLKACSAKLYLLFDAIYNDGNMLFQVNLPIWPATMVNPNELLAIALVTLRV
jgi:hypothetical protein